MVAMLPGVECARRRRLQGSGGWLDPPIAYGLTRRSSSSLSNNHESHLTSSSSLPYQDDRLGGLAGEAKERLDERLRAKWKSENKRTNTQERLIKVSEDRPMVMGDLHTEVFGLKKSGSKRLSWAKLGWRASDQDECAVCLEKFKAGETLVHPPCAHRFHTSCLVPWLENNAHCPCCRIEI